MTGWHRRFLAILAIPVCLSYCTEIEEIREPGSRTPASVEQEAWGWSTVVTRNGVPRVFVKAEHLVRPSPADPASLDGGVTVLFFGSTGKDTVSRLRSDRALLEDENDRLVAIGRVILTSRDSTHLATDTLVWNRKSDLIRGGGRVLIRRPGGEETGVGFEATSDLKRWSMREVTTRLTRPDTVP